MNTKYQPSRPHNSTPIIAAGNNDPRQVIERLRLKLIRETESYLNNPQARPWAKRPANQKF